jgi:hypothetical protein
MRQAVDDGPRLLDQSSVEYSIGDAKNVLTIKIALNLAKKTVHRTNPFRPMNSKISQDNDFLKLYKSASVRRKPFAGVWRGSFAPLSASFRRSSAAYLLLTTARVFLRCVG